MNLGPIVRLIANKIDYKEGYNPLPLNPFNINLEEKPECFNSLIGNESTLVFQILELKQKLNIDSKPINIRYD